MAGEWDHEEIEAVLDQYFEMLQLETLGKPYVKAKANREVQRRTGRPKGSVEFKFQNVSAVLQDIGRVWIQGYKPRSNYQGLLRDELEKRLDGGNLDWLPVADRGEAAETSPGAATPPPPASTDGAPQGYAAALARIQERSFGGSDVAVAPDHEHDPFWPEGPAAPGASELVGWLTHRCAEEGGPVLAFLIGGPGNGKSYLSSLLVRGMDLQDQEADGLAHRTYRYDTGGPKPLNLVNDATISRDDDSSLHAPLVVDIEEALQRGEHLVANVNRGILFEELTGSTSTGIGRLVAEWLHRARTRSVPDDGWSLEPRFDEPFFQSAELHGPAGEVVEVAAVYMDVCSLLERRPDVVLSEAGPAGQDTSVDDYEIARLDRRSSWEVNTTPAGALLSRFVARLPRPQDDMASKHDPFLANLQTLAEPDVQNGVCTILRAAELASAKRFTYRELWGAIARLIIGDSPQFMGLGSSPFDIVLAKNVDELRLEDMLELAAFRSHEAIFGASRCRLLKTPAPRPSPVTRVTSTVDPARDARPGTLGKGDGWADPVIEAFSGHSTGSRPLAELLTDEHLVPPEDPVRRAVTAFDHELDRHISYALGPNGRSDKDKRDLTAWYGQYLTRLYALSHGIPAFFRELTTWTRAWGRADGHSSPPGSLEDALRTLLLPSMDPDNPTSPFVLPALEPRTLPVSGRSDEPRLVVKVPTTWSLALRRDGDALFVKMREGGRDVEELELDFAMLREALACREGHIGVTEFTDTASPRLERFRAALLRPRTGSRLQYALVEGNTVHELEIG